MAKALQMTVFLTQLMAGKAGKVSKSSDPLRLGLLSTANINVGSIIHPVEAHPDVIISAVASRNLQKAQKYAKAHNIPTAYGSYQELLDEPGINAVYIGLPNGMHYEWATKALNAGKHVLVEKPFTSNAEEARKLTELAESKKLVLLEAFHWQFHPAAHAVKALLDSGEYGNIVRVSSAMGIPSGSVPKSDVRYQYALAGGALMDMTYVISTTRFFLGTNTIPEVVSTKPRLAKGDKRVDEAMEADLKYQIDGRTVEAHVYCDLARPAFLGFVPRFWETPDVEIETEKAKISFSNFMMPFLFHSVTIRDKKTGKATTKKFYSAPEQWKTKGQGWWSTYRWQLEAFVDKIRGKEPQHWITPESSVAQMETIDAIYEKAGLGKRGDAAIAAA